MSKIFIGYYYGKSWISKLIQLRSLSQISHISAFLPDRNNEEKPGNFVIEAWMPKVREIRWCEGHKKGTLIDIYEIPCTEKQQDCFYQGIKGELGKGYDLRGFLSFIRGRDYNNPNKWFCSELIYYCLNNAKIDLLQNVEPWQVWPKMLHISPRQKFCERRRV